MIKTYWKTLEWMTTHKLGYLAAVIYIIMAIIFTPVLILLLGIVSYLEVGTPSLMLREIIKMLKGGK